jgi:hypothetical protein
VSEEERGFRLPATVSGHAGASRAPSCRFAWNLTSSKRVDEVD